MPSSEDYLIKIQLQIQNDKALKALTTQMEKASKAAPKAGKAFKTASKSAGQFGNRATNVGYQLQDLVVQIQGGTDASRALSQQLPQMLIGFGAWGAAIGVVTALLPTLITLMKGMDAELRSSEKIFSDLDASVSNLGHTMNTIDLSGFINAFNEADSAQRKLLLSSLEYQQHLAKVELKAASGTFDPLPQRRGATVGRPGQAASRDFARQYDDAAEAIGVTSKQLKELQPLYEAATNSQTQSLETVSAYRLELEKLATSEQARNSNIDSSITSLYKMEEALKSIAEVNKTIGSAGAAGSSGLIPTGGSAGGGGDAEMLEEIKLKAVDLDTAMKIYYNNRKQEQEEFLQAQYDLEIAYGDTADVAIESFNAMDEAGKLFDSTFETAFDGVAMGTQSVSDAFENMAKSIIANLLKIAAQQAVMSAFGIGIFGATPNAKGNVFSGGNVIPFAKGGVVNSPTIFPMANGAGLMGEAGPEAIMPLSRGTNGKLGVEAAPVNVVINNNAPGVAVQQRQTDSGLTIDIVMQQMTTAIRRGGNDLSSALEDSYTLGRGRAVY